MISDLGRWIGQRGVPFFSFSFKDHPFKTSACLREGGVVIRSQYIRIKNPLHKHFAYRMPMVGG